MNSQNILEILFWVIMELDLVAKKGNRVQK